ncbi:MAG: efflux RND transporter permease subunit [Gemmatimonadales bacterium]
MSHILIATVGVAVLVWLSLGWREALVVLVAVPVTLALTLLVYRLLGYTLNRITLFALVFAIGILVDDAIVVVENIARHLAMKSRSSEEAAVEGVDEVGNPTILATFTVIAAILPMAFVSGLMGPYMRPIPVGASMAMLFSLAVAFIVTPYLALRLVREAAHGEHDEAATGRVGGWYRRLLERLLDRRGERYLAYAVVVLLLLGSMALVGVRLVTVKMLPFKTSKSEFRWCSMPEKPSRPAPAPPARSPSSWCAIGRARRADVRGHRIALQRFNGAWSALLPRQGPEVADLRVNLLPKHDRDEQSHDIAVRLRPGIESDRGPLRGPGQGRGDPAGAAGIRDHHSRGLRARTTARSASERRCGSAEALSRRRARRRRRLDRARPGRAPGDRPSRPRDARRPGRGRPGPAGRRLERTRGDRLDPGLRGGRPDRGPLRAPSGSARRRSGRCPCRRRPAPSWRPARSPGSRSATSGTRYRRISAGHLRHRGRRREIEARPTRCSSPIGAHRAGDQTTWTGAGVDTDRVSVNWDGEWQITYEVFRDLGVAFAASAGADLLPGRGLVPVLQDPARDHGADPLTLIGILPAHASAGRSSPRPR